jgi:hypothetical protein
MASAILIFNISGICVAVEKAWFLLFNQFDGRDIELAVWLLDEGITGV